MNLIYAPNHKYGTLGSYYISNVQIYLAKYLVEAWKKKHSRSAWHIMSSVFQDHGVYTPMKITNSENMSYLKSLNKEVKTRKWICYIEMELKISKPNFHSISVCTKIHLVYLSEKSQMWSVAWWFKWNSINRS